MGRENLRRSLLCTLARCSPLDCSVDVYTRPLVGRIPRGRRQRRHPSRRARLRCPAPSTPPSRRGSSVPQLPTCASSCLDGKLFGTRPVLPSVRSSSSLLVPRKGCHPTPTNAERRARSHRQRRFELPRPLQREKIPQGLCLFLEAHSRRRRKGIGSLCGVLFCNRKQFIEKQAQALVSIADLASSCAPPASGPPRPR